MSKAEEFSEIFDAIENEGFDYALNYYSDFKDIKDKKFQSLYKKYKDSRESLVTYLSKYGKVDI